MAYQSHLDDPEYWRDRAEQVRALADEVSNQTARDAILRIVADYNFLLLGRKNEPSDSFWVPQLGPYSCAVMPAGMRTGKPTWREPVPDSLKATRELWPSGLWDELPESSGSVHLLETLLHANAC
jgi:hypothetical protein